MVKSTKGMDPYFAELLYASQQFIRDVEEPFSVSLRDVKRAIQLANWFYKSLTMRRQSFASYPPKREADRRLRSYVLALGLCYQSRLYKRHLRRQYQEKMADSFQKVQQKEHMTVDYFNRVIKEEQIDFYKRMLVPKSTAANEALLENLLAMIVCINTRIPLFIIGAPGR
jgi:hypothetical protein